MSGRISSLRTSDASDAGDAGGARRERVRTDPAWNTLPSTAARSITARSSGRAGRDGRRAARGSSAEHGTDEVAGRRPAALLADKQAVVDQHREHLLDEERIPLGGVRDPGPDLRLRARPADEVLDQRAALVLGQRLEQDRRRVELPTAPGGADLE